jgi:hypothetical protein
MKSTIFLLVPVFLLSINESFAQMLNKTYDEAINNAIAKQYPEYHTGLIKVLDDFEKELISKKVLRDGTYENYVKVLKK